MVINNVKVELSRLINYSAFHLAVVQVIMNLMVVGNLQIQKFGGKLSFQMPTTPTADNNNNSNGVTK